MHITSGFSLRLSAALCGAVMSLVVSAAGLPLTAIAASPDVGPPNSIVVDRMPSPVEANGAGAFHAGQFVQYRVRYYDASGNLAPCNASGQPQVLQHNPANGAVIDRAWGAGTPGSGVVERAR